ncbi:MAG: LPS export ABC transporter periplasmic protein LptC [Vampirovibrionales bacterium]|nr:LPS export ABC transporter periplasmic protein LptC [Vampirovibrionales bacterium]
MPISFSLKRLALGGFLMLLVGAIALAAWNAARRIQVADEKQKAPDDTNEATTPGVSGKHVSFTVSENGQLAWKFSAQTVDYAGNGQTDGVAALSGVKGVYYDSKSQSSPASTASSANTKPPIALKPLAQFEAAQGEYDQSKKILHLTHGVRIAAFGGQGESATSGEKEASGNGKHPVIMADELTWQQSRTMLEAKGHVSVLTPGFGKTTAQRCQFSLDFSRIRLEGDARSEIVEVGS